MKKKTIVFAIIFSLLLISIIFINSYVQAFSKRGELDGRTNRIYKNREVTMKNCDNICKPNENCFVYQQNENCMQTNNQCLQKRCNETRNCGRQRNGHHNMCNR